MHIILVSLVIVLRQNPARLQPRRRESICLGNPGQRGPSRKRDSPLRSAWHPCFSYLGFCFTGSTWPCRARDANQGFPSPDGPSDPHRKHRRAVSAWAPLRNERAHRAPSNPELLKEHSCTRRKYLLYSWLTKNIDRIPA